METLIAARLLITWKYFQSLQVFFECFTGHCYHAEITCFKNNLKKTCTLEYVVLAHLLGGDQHNTGRTNSAGIQERTTTTCCRNNSSYKNNCFSWLLGVS